jgi:hypothetical protein
MADFARVENDEGMSVRINLDYVTRITPGVDPASRRRCGSPKGEAW